MPRNLGVRSVALLFTFFAFVAAQPLHISNRALTKRGGTSQAAKVVIGIAVALAVGMSFIFCCYCCAAQHVPDPEPTPQELADEVGVLRARVQQLEGDHAGAKPVEAPAVPPPTYTP
ncbi:hypothetical protein DFH09DRAFT_1067454 [Mycena vulgaris]|nr:hypothetical protein DFH09DRAFT_1067454 [Mycena vulgaris]